jgi:hypothetical protein
MFKEIIRQYTEYIGKDYNAKLHAGELLAGSAKLLLKIEKKNLDNNAALQRQFLMWKIAVDLLEQAQNMGWTKQYDCAPVLKEYNYLAFDLAFDYCEFKADRRLIPFITHVMYYEEYEKNKEYLEKLNSIYNQSLILEKKYIDDLIARGNSINMSDK